VGKEPKENPERRNKSERVTGVRGLHARTDGNKERQNRSRCTPSRTEGKINRKSQAGVREQDSSRGMLENQADGKQQSDGAAQSELGKRD
jgi:hypothetical protein